MKLIAAWLVFCGAALMHAQSADERLGPADSGHKNINALVEEMRTLHSQIKPEYTNVHPRVYFNASELQQLRAKAHGPQRAWWMKTLANARALQGDPPPPPAEMRRQQNNVAFAIAEAAFFYKIEGNKKYLDAAKKYMDAAVSYDVWGYSFSKPNVDLAAGHLLYGMGVAYDLLYNDLTEAERTKYRSCIARHAELLYNYFAPKRGRSWAYSQNHTFIPMAGLGVAAYAVYGEVPQAAKWAALARAIYDRTLATYSTDGYYYEGFEYWVFATPWIIHYLDAHKHATGEDLFDQPGLKLTHLYAAHSLTPGGEFSFDFGDVFEGPITRDRKGDDYERSHPNGKMESNYSLLYDLARRYRNPEIQGVADWMRSLGHTSQEVWWTLAWRDSTLASEPINEIQPWHRFEDHDVAYWRSGWDKAATAIAFKCGPAEGHHAAALIHKYPDWHIEQGHSHPDVNSFILWSGGHYLLGDSGYAGVPKTIEHNTLLINGHGQGSENGGHDAWAKYDYDRLNQVHINRADFRRDGFDLTGDGTGAYAASTGLTKFLRELHFSGGTLAIHDSLSAQKQSAFTEVMHADGTVEKSGTQNFTFHDGRGGSAVVELRKPAGAMLRIEDNVMMGPGKPGSVDKGTLEKRGQRLLAQPATQATDAAFDWKVTVISRGK